MAVRLSTSAQRLVGVRRFLRDDTTTGAAGTVAVIVGRAARAAANAESPENNRAQSESDGEPGGGVHVCTHGQSDTIGLEGIAEAGLEHAEQDCGCH